jgi:hypothetical protein
MNTPTRGRRGPQVDFDGARFRVSHRGRSVDVPAVLEDDELLVELDGLTHWAPAEGQHEGYEISIEELGEILDAIDKAADEAGLSISFD